PQYAWSSTTPASCRRSPPEANTSPTYALDFGGVFLPANRHQTCLPSRARTNPAVLISRFRMTPETSKLMLAALLPTLSVICQQPGCQGCRGACSTPPASSPSHRSGERCPCGHRCLFLQPTG